MIQGFTAPIILASFGKHHWPMVLYKVDIEHN